MPTTLQVKYRSMTVDEFVQQYGHHVSAKGIFVRTKDPLPLGVLVKFQFQLNDGVPVIGGTGSVVWRRSSEQGRSAPMGMGVQFLSLDPESERNIHRIIAERGGAPSRFEQLDGAETSAEGDPAALPTVARRGTIQGQPTIQGAPSPEASGPRPSAGRPAAPTERNVAKRPNDLAPLGNGGGRRHVRASTLPPGVVSAGPVLPNVVAPISAKTFVNAARKQRAAGMAGLFSGTPVPGVTTEGSSPIASFFPPPPPGGASSGPAAKVPSAVPPPLGRPSALGIGTPDRAVRGHMSTAPPSRSLAARRRTTTAPPVTPPSPVGDSAAASTSALAGASSAPFAVSGGDERDVSGFTVARPPAFHPSADVGTGGSARPPTEAGAARDAEGGALAELFSDLGDVPRIPGPPAADPLDPELSEAEDSAADRVRARLATPDRIAIGEHASSLTDVVEPPASLEPVASGSLRDSRGPSESSRGLYYVLLGVAILAVPFIAFVVVQDGMDAEVQGELQAAPVPVEQEQLAALPPEPESAPPEPEKVSTRLVVQTVPSEAEVWLGEEPAGATPVTVEVPIGRETLLRIKKTGYAELLHTVIPQSEQVEPVKLELQSLPYVLSVETVPSGAEVIFVGQRLVSPGEFRVRGLKRREPLVVNKAGFRQVVRPVQQEQFEERNGRMVAATKLWLTPVGRTASPVPGGRLPGQRTVGAGRSSGGRRTAPGTSPRGKARRAPGGSEPRVAPAPPTPPPEVPLVDPRLGGAARSPALPRE